MLVQYFINDQKIAFDNELNNNDYLGRKKNTCKLIMSEKKLKTKQKTILL